MYKVSEIVDLDLPADGIASSLKGKFYYCITQDRKNKFDFFNCYITDASDTESPRVYLPNDVGETVIDKDETFGMMVGGEFAYYGLNAEIYCVIKKTARGLIGESVKSLKLEKDGENQEFNF